MSVGPPSPSPGGSSSLHFSTLRALLLDLHNQPMHNFTARTALYQSIFDHLKHGSVSSDLHESVSDLASIVAALPEFYEGISQDVQRTITFEQEKENKKEQDKNEINSAQITSTPTPAVPAAAPSPPPSGSNPMNPRAREALLLARAAVRALGYFLHHPTFCTHVPLSRSSRSRSIPSSLPSVDSADPADGLTVLIRVLANTHDRQLACMIAWSLAEQCIVPAVLALYVDDCIDAFLIALDRCQSTSTGRSAATAAAPLQQEILHALWKFTRHAPQTLRARCRSSAPNSLDWLRQLVLLPYLNPAFYFDATKSETSLELRKISLHLFDVFLGSVPDSAGAHLLRCCSTHPCVFDFCCRCQKAIQDQVWVKSVTEKVQTRMIELGTQLTKDKAAETARAPNDTTHAQVEYEGKVAALYTDAFALLNVYLNCMGKIATIMNPTVSASASGGHTATASQSGSASAASLPLPPPPVTSNSSAAAINSFLTFYQPLFGHTLPVIRQAVFSHAWKNVVRVLNTEESSDSLPSHTSSSGGRPLIAPNKKPHLPLTMKPFIHQLAKEKDTSVVGAIIKVWLEIVGENFTHHQHRHAAPPPPPDTNQPTPPDHTKLHRIQQQSVYDECIGKVLHLLCGKLACESSAGCDTHLRSRMIDELLDGLRYTPPTSTTANGPSIPSTGEQRETQTHTSMYTTSTAASGSTSASGAILSQVAGPPALAWTTTLMQILLSRNTPVTIRTSFLKHIIQLISKSVIRIGGANEKKSWMSLYQHLIDFALQHASQSSVASDLRPLDPSPTPPTNVTASAASGDPRTLIQALFQAWSTSAAHMANMIPATPTTPPNALNETTSATHTAMLTDRQVTRIQWSCSMQFNMLKAWLNVYSDLDSLPGGSLALCDDIVPSTRITPVESGYNGTPTPSSAPIASNAPAVSPAIITLAHRWITICAPLLTQTAVASMSGGAQEKIRDIFLDGICTLLTQYLSGRPSSSLLSHGGLAFKAILDLLSKLVTRDSSHANACWLVWLVLVKAQTMIVDQLMPPNVAQHDDSHTPPTPTSIGDVSCEASLPTGSVKPPSKTGIERGASGLHRLIMAQPDTDSVPERSTIEANENAIETFIALVTNIIPMQSDKPISIDIMSTFTSASTRLLHLAVHVSGAPLNEQPDVMSMLVQSMLECQKVLSIGASQLALDVFTRLVASIIGELHPAASTAVRLSSPASSSSANWKQWKSHPDAMIQRMVCGAIEIAINSVESSSDASESSPVNMPSFLVSLLMSLSHLFGRFPHSASCIDAVSWFLRLMSIFHALLKLTDGRKASSPTPTTSVAIQPTISPVIELWSAAMTAFRKNFHGELDFQLLQTAVGKINATSGTTPASSNQSTSSASKPLLFIDVLTASLRHSHPLIRSTGVHFWSHTYASKRHGVMPCSKLLFGAQPEFVAACQSLVAAGELKLQHMPLTQPAQTPSPMPTPTHTNTPGRHTPKSPAFIMHASRSPKLQFEHLSPDALADPMELDPDADDMGLEGMLAGEPVKAADSNAASDPPPHSGQRSVPARSPLNTAHSFLPAKSKKLNLLDRLSDLPEHAFPPDPIIKAPAQTHTPATPFTADASQPQENQTNQPGDPPPDKEHGQSTLSPFPMTPACAMVSGSPLVSPTSAVVHAPIERVVSELVPRALAMDFDAAAAAAAHTNSSHLTDSGAPPQRNTMDDSNGADMPPTNNGSAIHSTIDQRADALPEPRDQRTTSVLSDVRETAALEPESDVAPSSLSLPIGSSISQPQQQLPASQPSDGLSDPVVQVGGDADPVAVVSPPLLLPPSHGALAIHSQPIIGVAPPAVRTANEPHSEPIITPTITHDATRQTAEEKDGEEPAPQVHEISQQLSESMSGEIHSDSPPGEAASSTPCDSPSIGSHSDVDLMEVDPIVEVVLPTDTAVTAPARSQSREEENELSEKVNQITPATTDAAPPAGSPAIAEVSPPVLGVRAPSGCPTPTSRKRDFDPSVSGVSPSPASKRVMFCDKRNVEISPSPCFSAITASIEEHANNQPNEDQQGEEQKDKSTADDVKADRRAERDQRKKLHEERKAQLKAAIQPAVAAPTNAPLPSILKSPTKSPAKAKIVGGSQDSAAVASPLYPPLAADLTPLSSLSPCFASTDLTPSFMELFTANHFVTVGDVASSPHGAMQTNVPIALRLHIAQATHAGESITVAQMVLESLKEFERRSEQRKRKAEEESCVRSDVPHVSKKAKLVGPIESLQTTEQQEAWLERMLASGAPSDTTATTQTQLHDSSVVASAAAPPMSRPTPPPHPAQPGHNSHSQPHSATSEVHASPMAPFVAPELTIDTSIKQTTEKPQTKSHTTKFAPKKIVNRPIATTPTPTPANTHNTIPPPAHTDEVAHPPQVPVHVAPVAPVSVFAPDVGPAAMAVDAGCVSTPLVSGVALAGVDESDEVCDLVDSEPMSRQIDEVRFYMRSTIATLFAPEAPTTTITHANGTPTGPPSKMSVIQHLTLAQLHELNSYLQTVNVAVAQQINKHNKREQRRAAANTPTRTNSNRQETTSPMQHNYNPQRK